jgi:hypothetical protein
VHELDEVRPRGRPVVELESMIPDLGVVQEVEGGVLDALMFQGAAEWKVALTTVESSHGIANPIELGKLNFVNGGRKVVVDGV